MEVLAGFAIFFVIFIMIISLVAIAASVLTIIGYWKVFEKAGKPGWASIVPYYNQWVLFELGNYPPYLIFISVGASFLSGIAGGFSAFVESNEVFYIPYIIFMGLASLASIAIMVFNILVNLNIAKKFGKSAGYGVGLALLPFVFYPMLGFDKNAVYTEEVK